MECSADELKRALDQLGQELSGNLHFKTSLHSAAEAIEKLSPFVEEAREKDCLDAHVSLVQAFDFLKDFVERRADIYEAARTLILEGASLAQQCPSG